MASGGDGSSVQFCNFCRCFIPFFKNLVFSNHDSDSAVYDEGYVGILPSQATVIRVVPVAHQGTDPEKMFVQFFTLYFLKTADNM